MLLPLLSLGVGAIGAAEAATRKDPTARLQAEMEKQAKMSEKFAQQNFAGGGAADIRNTAANRTASAVNKSTASGQGYTPRLAEHLAQIAGEEASGVSQLRIADAQRRQQLLQQASQTRSDVETLRSSFQQQRRSDIFGSITGGISGAMNITQQGRENDELRRMMQVYSGGTQ